MSIIQQPQTGQTHLGHIRTHALDDPLLLRHDHIHERSDRVGRRARARQLAREDVRLAEEREQEEGLAAPELAAHERELAEREVDAQVEQDELLLRRRRYGRGGTRAADAVLWPRDRRVLQCDGL